VTQIPRNGQPNYDHNSKISEVITSKLPLGIPVSVALSALILYQANHDMNQSFRIIVSSERSILHAGADGMLLNIKESSLWEY
jgi:hypothetical protein